MDLTDGDTKIIAYIRDENIFGNVEIFDTPLNCLAAIKKWSFEVVLFKKELQVVLIIE